MTDPTRHPTLVAWQCDDDDSACIVFARTELGASRLVRFQDGFDGYEPEYGERIRAPEFDHFAPGPVPLSALLEAGWRYECDWCSHTVDVDGCEECADPCSSCEKGEEACSSCEKDGAEWISPAPVIRDDADEVYCSQACADAEDAERNAKKAREAECRLKCREALARYPSAEIWRYWPGMNLGEEHIDVKIPGLTYTVDWRANSPEDLWIHPDDQAALERVRVETAPKEEP